MSSSVIRTTSTWARLLLVVALLVASLMLGATPQADAASSKTPSRLKGTDATTTSLTVTWKKVSKAPGYRLQYSTSSKMKKPKYKRATKATATLTGLEPGKTYYVKVRVINKRGASLSKYSKAIKVKTPAEVTEEGGASTPPPTSTPVSNPPKPASGEALRVASYNIKCANCYSGEPNEERWEVRREAVVDTILDQHLDVVGLQEAGQGWLKGADGKSIPLSQFEDLTDRLGGAWKLTNANRNNCVKAYTPTKCVYKDQGASQDSRIIFDSSRIQLLDQGSKRLPYLKTSDNARYVAWAQFRQISTGNRFMFASTHLEYKKDPSGSTAYHDLRREQAQVALAAVNANNPGHLPVVFVGDLNSSRFVHSYSPTNAPYDVLTGGGLVDPLGLAAGSTRTAPGAIVGKRINTWIDSFNNFRRTVPTHKNWINGSYIDYMFVSPSIAVPEWETVANMDADGKFVGVIPSDHNMIRASLVLPRTA